MNLKIGITELLPHWKILLDQIGVSYKVIGDNKYLDPENYAAIIITGSLSGEDSNKYSAYLKNGGTILLEADTAKNLFEIGVSKKYIKYINTINDSSFFAPVVCDVYDKCLIPDNSNCLKNQNSKNTTLINSFGVGHYIVLPSGLAASVLKNKIIRKNFYSRWGSKQTSERVSQVNKGMISYIIKRALEILFHKRRLPFIHVWNFPNGSKSIFNFRIDTDFGTRDEVDKLYEVIDKNNVRATWFIETKSKKDWVNIFSEFKNQEIGYHCYKHKLISKYEELKNDFVQGLAILEAEGIKPSGYATPYGEWSELVGALTQEFQFLYSSEFGIAHDGLPFYSYFKSTFSNVLQVPIHPISPGRLAHGGNSEEKLIDYFKDVIQQKLFLSEPIFFYIHPFERRYDFLNDLFKEVDKLGLPVTTLEDFALWWKKRNDTDWNCEYINDKININTDNSDDTIWIHASFPTNENLLAPLSKGIFPHVMSIKKPSEESFPKYDVKMLRKFSLRMLKNDVQFKYRKIKQ